MRRGRVPAPEIASPMYDIIEGEARGLPYPNPLEEAVLRAVADFQPPRVSTRLAFPLRATSRPPRARRLRSLRRTRDTPWAREVLPQGKQATRLYLTRTRRRITSGLVADECEAVFVGATGNDVIVMLSFPRSRAGPFSFTVQLFVHWQPLTQAQHVYCYDHTVQPSSYFSAIESDVGSSSLSG